MQLTPSIKHFKDLAILTLNGSFSRCQRSAYFSSKSEAILYKTNHSSDKTNHSYKTNRSKIRQIICQIRQIIHKIRQANSKLCMYC